MIRYIKENNEIYDYNNAMEYGQEVKEMMEQSQMNEVFGPEEFESDGGYFVQVVGMITNVDEDDPEYYVIIEFNSPERDQYKEGHIQVIKQNISGRGQQDTLHNFQNFNQLEQFLSSYYFFQNDVNKAKKSADDKFYNNFKDDDWGF